MICPNSSLSELAAHQLGLSSSLAPSSRPSPRGSLAATGPNQGLSAGHFLQTGFHKLAQTTFQLARNTVLFVVVVVSPCSVHAQITYLLASSARSSDCSSSRTRELTCTRQSALVNWSMLHLLPMDAFYMSAIFLESAVFVEPAVSLEVLVLRRNGPQS